MKSFLMLVVALVLVYVVWRILMGIVIGLLGTVFHLALIGLFCYLVYVVFKALTAPRERV